MWKGREEGKEVKMERGRCGRKGEKGRNEKGKYKVEREKGRIDRGKNGKKDRGE